MSATVKPILVVEDEDDIRVNVRELLEDAGYRVIEASNGREAMHWLREHRPAVVILDLRLPFVSGNEVYQVMQKTPGLDTVPVLITTADPTASPPGVAILAKPLDLDALLRTVALCIQGPRPNVPAFR